MFRCILPLLFLFAGLLNLHAQERPVVVADVDFNNSVGNYRWNNVTVKLRAIVNPDPKAYNEKYVDNVGIRVTLGYLIDRRENTFYFLQTEATIATLEINQDKLLAFWIPYDIVERGDLANEPDYWIIELTVDGKAVPMDKPNTSSSISDLAAAQIFLNRANADASKTEGILVPYYLSPYAPVDRSPPAFIRKEPK